MHDCYSDFYGDQLLAETSERWDEYYEQHSVSPRAFLLELSESKTAWLLDEGLTRAIFWTEVSFRGDRMPLFHILLLRGTTEPWISIMDFVMHTMDIDGISIAGLAGQKAAYRWLRRLPYSDMFVVPCSRTDPRTFQLTDYWECVILKRKYINARAGARI